jgi:hypothetical protein
MSLILCSSCATIFNGALTHVTVHTTAPSGIIFNEDTVHTVSNRAHLHVPRTGQPLQIIVIRDSLRKPVTIRHNHSIAFYSNVFNYGIGVALDIASPKRFGYPQKVFLNSSDSTNEYSHYGKANNKGELMIHLSVPYYNSFYVTPAYGQRKAKGGFWGLSAGVDYYYSKDKFLNFSGVLSMNTTPFPRVFFFLLDQEILSSNYLALSNNHKIRRFSVGYGFTFGRNYWFGRYINLFGLQNPDNAASELSNNTYGLIFSAYYQIRQYSNLGIIYRPTFVRPDFRDLFKYEHVISLDLAVKIRVKK